MPRTEVTVSLLPHGLHWDFYSRDPVLSPIKISLFKGEGQASIRRYRKYFKVENEYRPNAKCNSVCLSLQKDSLTHSKETQLNLDNSNFGRRNCYTHSKGRKVKRFALNCNYFNYK